MKCENFFYDGYTREGFIASAPLLHSSLRFAYRPALVEERSQLVDSAASTRSDTYDRQVAAFLADKLVSWDLVDGKGQSVAPSAATILRLQPELFVRLYRVVMGWAGSDPDPRWSDEQVDRGAKEELVSALSGKSVGEVRQETDEKN